MLTPYQTGRRDALEKLGLKETFPGIPEHLVEEAKRNPWLRRRAPTMFEEGREATPIMDGDKVVGFHAPAKTKMTGKKTTGSIYVTKEHRGKGLGTEALKKFIDDNPEAISFVHVNNKSSRAAHEKAGFRDTGRRALRNPRATIWNKKGTTRP